MMSNVPLEYKALLTNKPLVSTSHQGSASSSPDYCHGDSNQSSYLYGYYGNYHSQGHDSYCPQRHESRSGGYPSSNYFYGGYHDHDSVSPSTDYCHGYYSNNQYDKNVKSCQESKYTCYEAYKDYYQGNYVTHRTQGNATHHQGYPNYHYSGYTAYRQEGCVACRCKSHTHQGSSINHVATMWHNPLPTTNKASSSMASTTSGSTKVPTTMISPSVRVPWQGGSVTQDTMKASTSHLSVMNVGTSLPTYVTPVLQDIKKSLLQSTGPQCIEHKTSAPQPVHVQIPSTSHILNDNTDDTANVHQVSDKGFLQSYPKIDKVDTINDVMVDDNSSTKYSDIPTYNEEYEYIIFHYPVSLQHPSIQDDVSYQSSDHENASDGIAALGLSPSTTNNKDAKSSAPNPRDNTDILHFLEAVGTTHVPPQDPNKPKCSINTSPGDAVCCQMCSKPSIQTLLMCEDCKPPMNSNLAPVQNTLVVVHSIKQQILATRIVADQLLQSITQIVSQRSIDNLDKIGISFSKNISCHAIQENTFLDVISPYDLSDSCIGATLFKDQFQVISNQAANILFVSSPAIQHKPVAWMIKMGKTNKFCVLVVCVLYVDPPISFVRLAQALNHGNEKSDAWPDCKRLLGSNDSAAKHIYDTNQKVIICIRAMVSCCGL
jgi:hypothetical protein